MIYGWDISTSVVGASVFSNEGTWKNSFFVDLRKLDKDLLAKADEVRKFCEFLMEEGVCGWWTRGEQNTHFIEDRLSGFTRGATQMNTILKLATFNGMVSYVVSRTLAGDVMHLHPSSVKSLVGLVVPKGGDKKKETLKLVSALNPSFPVLKNSKGNPQPYVYDMADSYITGLAGLKKLAIL